MAFKHLRDMYVIGYWKVLKQGIACGYHTGDDFIRAGLAVLTWAPNIFFLRLRRELNLSSSSLLTIPLLALGAQWSQMAKTWPNIRSRFIPYLKNVPILVPLLFNLNFCSANQIRNPCTEKPLYTIFCWHYTIFQYEVRHIRSANLFLKNIKFEISYLKITMD